MSLAAVIILIGIVFGAFLFLPAIGQALRTMLHNPLLTLGMLVVLAAVVAFMSGAV